MGAYRAIYATVPDDRLFGERQQTPWEGRKVEIFLERIHIFIVRNRLTLVQRFNLTILM